MTGDVHDPILARARETGQVHAANCGTGHPTPVPAWEGVDRTEKWLNRAMTAAVGAEPAESSAAEWLLDNAYQVQRATLLIDQDLPPGFYRRLRPLANGPAKGEPVVLALAHDMLQAAHFQLSRQAVLAYLKGYQEHNPLDIAELWAFPVMLRVACLERLTSGFAKVFVAVPAPFPASASCRAYLDGADPAECVSRGVANLAVISSIAWKDIFDAASRVEQRLAEDPAGIYPVMDFETRDRYRRAVERLAERSTHNEASVAQAAVNLALSHAEEPQNHVGFWLVGQGLPRLEQAVAAVPPVPLRLGRSLLQHPGAVYNIGLLLLGVAGLSVPAAYLWLWDATAAQWLIGLALSALPATVLSVTVVNWLVTQTVKPTRLPKLDFSKSIGPAWRTVVAMPVIVSHAEEVPALLRRLEAHRLANPAAHGFALLSDPADANQERCTADAQVERALTSGIEALNRQYGKGSDSGPFFLLHRFRQFNPAQGCWMAWERKRGKLAQFNHFLLSGDLQAFALTSGKIKRLPGARFVVTADADTRLPPGSVARLAAALAHPLNRPIFNAEGRVVSGYTVLQPRVELAPHGSNSLFARLFGGDTAVDIYSRAVSDVFQDLTGSGSYVGKGIYDVAAFERSVTGRVPENNLLSHDLWEGLHGRAGLVSDIMVYESFPTNYVEYSRRWHRWVRGDWQLLPWLFPTVPGAGGTRLRNRLTVFDRMRVWDTMRRSLVPASVVLLLLGGWFVLPGQPIVWTALAVAAPAAYLFTDLVTGLARGRRRGVRTGSGHRLGGDLARWVLSLAFLISDAAVSLHAIGATLLRLGTGRNLLEWTSAAHVTKQQSASNPRTSHWRRMWISPAVAVVLLAFLLARPGSLLVAAPLLALWFLAPELARLTGRERVEDQQQLDHADHAFLRLVARRSWLFFEDYVRPEDNWLPPDNHQEEPIEATAHRTSPTNVGMMALAALSAWRMGHIGASELAVRMRDMLDAIDRLEHWRGHMLNWFDTVTLAPLEPRYVSAVDSGNLAVSLITLAKGCRKIAARPPVDPERWLGLNDCLALLDEAIEAAALRDPSLIKAAIVQLRDEARSASGPGDWPAMLSWCEEKFGEIKRQLTIQLDAPLTSPPGSVRGLRSWLERSEHHIAAMRRDVTVMLPWQAALADAPEDCRELAAELAGILDAAQPLADWPSIGRAADAAMADVKGQRRTAATRRWLDTLKGEVKAGLEAWQQLEQRLTSVALRACEFADGMDFSALYDPHQRLFYIGYDLSADRLDQHHYDLLASEARLASFFAIAKNDVPPEHWFQLGRPIVKQAGDLALASWNGSMFEYLMPCLFLRSDPHTLLGESNRNSVDIQRQYGRANGVPWGISESAFASIGPDGSWRYRAFGIPALGLRRGLSQDLVIAPYATALALSLRPGDAVDNLRHLASIGALGRCGFYEAIDFTSERRAEGSTHAQVRCYMAHHHGMSIAAIANALFDDMFVAWFHADPRVETVDLLLNERVPKELPPEIERLDPPVAPVAEGVAVPRPLPWAPRSAGPAPALHVLGNGRLSTQIGKDGTGELRWKSYALTRPGEAHGGNGHFIYLKDKADGATWCVTEGALDSHGERHAVFHSYKAELHCRAHDISSTLEILVAPAEDVEIRRLRLVNGSPHERRIEVASHAEIALAPAAEWLRHPAFAKLFVGAEVLPETAALLFERRTRDAVESPPSMIVRLIGDPALVELSGKEVSRQQTRVRHGDASEYPVFADQRAMYPQFPLDPIAALRADVTIPPHGEAELAIVTTIAASRDEALDLMRRYGSIASLDWAEHDAAARTAREVHGLGLASDQLADAQLLYTALHGRPGPRGDDPGPVTRDALWAMGLSGDMPILLSELEEDFDGAQLRFLLGAHRLWRWRGSPVDLALLHPGLPGYIEPLRDRLIDVLREMGSSEQLGERGGVHLLGREQIEPVRIAALRAAAGATLIDGGGPVAAQLAAWLPDAPIGAPFAATGRSVSEPPLLAVESLPLRFANGFGGFTPTGNYRLDVAPGHNTPAPWCNVLANEGFGAIVTEAGLGFSFAGNSGENRLTPWYNDPLCDPQGEAIYLRDEETAEIWSITPLPSGGSGQIRVEHRLGETCWTRESNGLLQEQSCMVAATESVKLVRVRLTDRIGVPRRITATFFADFLLGAVQGEPGPFRKAWYSHADKALMASNGWHHDFAGQTAFLAATLPPHSLTTSRSEFIGAAANWRQPRGLTEWELGNRVGNNGADAAAALQVHADIAGGGSAEFAFILGAADSAEDAAGLVSRWNNLGRVKAETANVAHVWDKRCGAVEVATPDPAFDLMVNRWLPYQAMSSRLFARAGFYQAGGAYGFRDQLQDVLALLHSEPELVRAQILRAAQRQFEEGDVLHWWHPPSGRGVRTRYSDDLLWLPLAVARYAEATGSTGLLDERVPFLHAAELSNDEHDRFAEYPQGKVASLYEHCLRAFDRAWRLGEHGLPLIGEGDWNDGMNRIGLGGKGESVWLGWFLAATIRSFAPVADRHGRGEFGKRWLGRAKKLVAAIEKEAWDGEWYMRAFDDIGRPWGSSNCDECKIDSLTQSWAVIAGGGDNARARTAINSAFVHLVRPDDDIARLLDPPFAATQRDPGYIKAYPPGIRENGGQYSHAAAWLGIAAAMQNDGDRAKAIFDRINPVLHSADKARASRYLVEPYAVAADIAGTDPWLGRGGWSWYTGAAAWAWRLAVEHILGMSLVDGQIALSPCLPADWPGFTATLRGAGTIEVSVTRGETEGFAVDGAPAPRAPIAFPGSGRTSRVLLTIGGHAGGAQPETETAGDRVTGLVRT